MQLNGTCLLNAKASAKVMDNLKTTVGAIVQKLNLGVTIFPFPS
jgi:hypothetical protein